MVTFEPRCKVCSSPNRNFYEQRFLEDEDKVTWNDLAEQAVVLGEEISYKAFERHFKKHFSAKVKEFIDDDNEVEKEKVKSEVINVVGEIKQNLTGLKTLLGAALSAYKEKEINPAMLRGLTDLYREHRQSIESCEKITSKLTEGTVLSEAEILRILYQFAKDFCPDCMESFRVNLDEYIRKKNSEKHV